MLNDPLKTFLRRSLLVASVPTLSGCFYCGGGECGRVKVVAWDGGASDGGLLSDGGLTFAGCSEVCGNAPDQCFVADAGLIACENICIGGRAPPGLVSLSTVDASAGSWLARMAELEAAAVHAFSHLSDELTAHGLSGFAAHALTAAGHEIRHAEAVTRLALGMGHCPTPQRINPTPLRSLEEVALDNAGEGCGRELIGAMINFHQAQSATDPLVRQAMAAIAKDELAHAELSFELARALMPKLTVAQRRQAREAQERTLLHLATDEIPGAARKALGLMDEGQLTATAQRLLDTSRL